jgi:hypothetical protein
VYSNTTGKEGLIFAFSEAQGWTAAMEDRISISCPVPTRPAWSLFCLFDGHGGSFCSQQLAATIVDLVVEQAKLADLKMGSSYLPGGTGNDMDTTPEMLNILLSNVCKIADERLQSQPRMKVTREKSGKLTCMNSSGSTAVIALVTSIYIVVANVGDSRAVLAKKSSESLSTAELCAHPFAVSRESPREEFASPAAVVGEEAAIKTTSSSDQMHRGRRSSQTNATLEAVALSWDHKCRIPEEKQRAINAGARLVFYVVFIALRIS